jgi:small-conductance mechanosensitive channel
VPGRPFPRRQRALSLVHFAASALLVLSASARAFNDGLGEPPKDFDRSSPSATVQSFLTETRNGHFGAAAAALWLDHLPKAEQAPEGARLARRLRFVLDRQPLDLSALPKEGEGGAGAVVLATLELDDRPAPVRLVRIRNPDSTFWVFSRDTVGRVDALYDAYGPPFAEYIPALLFATRLGLELWQWLGLLVALLASLLVGWLGEKVLVGLLSRLARLARLTLDGELARAARGPLKLLVWILVLQSIQPRLLLPPSWERLLDRVCTSLAIIATTWFALRALDVAVWAMNRRLASRARGAAAGAQTQVAVLWRVLSIVIYVLGLAALLMQFNVVRTVGVSLLASAGVVGVVVGLAAQKSISALFAGIQLSITQPIRLGDRVVVEGETGTVAEISLTFVVLRLSDNRHLVLPVSYFLEKPFQNWTREPVEMLAMVLLQLDFRVEVGAVRAEFDRILNGPAKALWTGRLAKVQVTDSSEATATVRLVASATDADSAFDLRCLIREEFLAFLREHPDWLPIQRVEHRPTPEKS